MDAKTILEKYQATDCTAEEQSLTGRRITYEVVIPQDLLAMEPDLDELRLRTVGPHIKTIKMIRLARIAAVAAAIAIFLSLDTLTFAPDKSPPAAYTDDVDPGTYKATLTLANGININLSDARSGPLLKREGIEITKAEDGTLVYKILGSTSSVSGYNTITTPRGGQYKIIMSDGTKVWLNAASSLSFNIAANGTVGLRKAKLVGEAYFEVKKDKAHPFIVTTDQQEIEVLGTHFNVSAYQDEQSIKTTLLEGSVRIAARLPQDREGAGSDRSGVILKPNQQSTLTQNNIQIAEVDTEEAVAWKNGEFNFINEPLETIMPQIARWYNVDVVYEDKKLARKLAGSMISRSEKLSKVLSFLEAAGDVHFKVVGKKVIVMK